MEILSSGELANLTKREADVAIRVVYDRKTLPLNLHGLKGPELFGGVYISRDRLAAWRAGAPDPIRWVVISVHGISAWAGEGEVSTKIGRASCRERVCQDVLILGVAGAFKKK